VLSPNCDAPVTPALQIGEPQRRQLLQHLASIGTTIWRRLFKTAFTSRSVSALGSRLWPLPRSSAVAKHASLPWIGWSAVTSNHGLRHGSLAEMTIGRLSRFRILPVHRW
jgi:hypothetical protein